MRHARVFPTAARRGPGAFAGVVLAGLSLAGAQAAQPPTTRLVTVAVYGDSVVEGTDIPDYSRNGLVPQLRARLRTTGGFETPGAGFIPASYAAWHYNAKTLPVGRTPAPSVWVLGGEITPALDGLSGYTAVAVSHAATAVAPVDAPSIDVLFTRSAAAGVFTVRAGSKTFAIDAHKTGSPAPAEHWITLPATPTAIVVHGPPTGRLTFGGVIVRGRTTPGRLGVEVENLGHTGHYLGQVAAPRTLAAIRAQRFDISVFLGAYKREIDAQVGDAAKAEDAYARELRARAAFVRRYGGLCLIADPSPMPVPPAITLAFAQIDRQVAASEGCVYTEALAHLWNPKTAVETRMTIVDGIHPTASGYRLIADALVPLLASLVRDRA